MLVPAPADRIPPCQAGCPNGNDVRGWIAIVAQRHRIGEDTDTALRRAWERLVQTNPFPATMGRICPHPCEAACSRREKDGAVAIHTLERFLGDWALAAGLELARDAQAPGRESVGVVGGGPAGLSFAYQMARRGYRVTVYERSARLGGMLLHGIPEYRLPERILEAEVERILELGVEVKLGSCVGRDVSLPELRRRHAALFVGIGAQRGRGLGVPGEDGPGVLTGIDFLAAVNRGDAPSMGGRVVVVGGGNTAIDAARTALRLGASVTVLYRRTREEMPAIVEEVEEALAEGVELVLLAAPVRLLREGGRLVAVEVQRMRLGEPDGSGRRRPVPLAGETFWICTDSVVAAVSQEPDRDLLEQVGADAWTGGDVRGLGIAAMAIAQGREAAEAAHRRLRGLDGTPAADGRLPLAPEDVKLDLYQERSAVVVPALTVQERLAEPERESAATIGEAQLLAEAGRCLSCGLCFQCLHCWTYCNAGAFTPVAGPRPGAYFAFSRDLCEGCGKCIDLCPCGFLSTESPARLPT